MVVLREREGLACVYGESSLAAEDHVQVKPLSRNGVAVRWWQGAEKAGSIGGTGLLIGLEGYSGHGGDSG